MKTDPIVFESSSDPGSVLERKQVLANSDMSESWLQGFVFDHPGILPISQFDETEGNLIPIARELQTEVGAIDVVFVTPNGTLVIVETKLWKNPEKHRTVVAQIIDYAKELARWSYEDLDNAVKKASAKGNTKKGTSGITEILKEARSTGIEAVEFQESVQKKLSRGEFILLIIGDRISPNVALLSDWISSAPGLNFRFGLVEMKMYALKSGSDWPLLVVPDIVGRTVEKTRGVVQVQYFHEKPDVRVQSAGKEIRNETKAKTTRDEFLSKLDEDLSPIYEQWFSRWSKRRFLVYWGISGFSLRIRRNNKLQTVFDAYPDLAASVIREVDAENLEIPTALYQEYKKTVDLNVPGASQVLTSGKKYIKPEEITPEGLEHLLVETTRVAEKLSDI